jgi:hypothetical protein
MLQLFEGWLADGSAFAGCVTIGAELGVEWHQGKLKKEQRILEKALLRENRFNEIRDYARGCFIVDDLGDIARILSRIETGTEYRIARTKNRFAIEYDAHESSGYRDFQLLAEINGGYLVEIQIIPRQMYNIKSKLGQAVERVGNASISGHGAYKEYRSIREAKQRLGRKSVTGIEAQFSAALSDIGGSYIDLSGGSGGGGVSSGVEPSSGSSHQAGVRSSFNHNSSLMTSTHYYPSGGAFENAF